MDLRSVRMSVPGVDQLKAELKKRDDQVLALQNMIENFRLRLELCEGKLKRAGIPLPR